MANECVVYHKHLAGMDLTDGYIGISKNFEERMKQHHREAFVCESVYTVHEQMRKHGKNVMTSKIFEGTIQECFDYEEELRPRWRMGWNMAIGGGRAGSGWKVGKNWLDNRVWHPQYGEQVLTKANTCTDVGRKYGVSGNGISDVLRAKTPTFKGWELADAQLAMQIKERFNKKWSHVYITNGEVTVSVHSSGNKHFSKAYGARSDTIHCIYTASQKHKGGWSLTYEQEWLETAERVEFK